MVRTTNYYADQIAARYPDLPAAEIRKLCQLLMRRIYGCALRNQDVRLTSNAHKLSLKIYKPYYSIREHNSAVSDLARRRWCRRRFPVKQKNTSPAPL
jgi:hypothetical protein